MVGQVIGVWGRSGAAVWAYVPCWLFRLLRVFLLVRALGAGFLKSLHVVKLIDIKGVGETCPTCPVFSRSGQSAATWPGQVGLPGLPLACSGAAL